MTAAPTRTPGAPSRARTATGVFRSWPGLAGIGAGLVLAALAAGAVGGTGLALAGLGVAALGAGVAALRAGRVVLPRTTLAVVVVLLLAAAAAASSGLLPALGIPGGPLLAACAFLVVPATAAALRLRAPLRVPGERSPRQGTIDRWPALVGMLAGAVLTAALATPALAATAAGELAVPHGQLHSEHAGH
ncbi:hypothetical protein [Agromyces rhizosphaerae]|nr:hypothetical protein [Agromyces rhizosphaerae]